MSRRTAHRFGRSRPLPLTARGATGLLALLVLCGCVGLNADGRVQPGLEVSGQATQRFESLVEGPKPGVSATQVIAGFLRANTARGEDVQVARQFLTSEVAAQWNAEGDIVVFEAPPEPQIVPFDEGAEPAGPDVATNTFAVRGAAVAVIGADGRWRPESTPRSAEVSVTRVNGEWRISALPDDFGRWVDRPQFADLTTEVELTYLSSLGNQPIPDLRHVIADRRLATRVAKLQLGPIPPYLRGAVRSGAGEYGLQLVSDSVPVTDGVAAVDLRAGGLSSDPADWRRLWAQLVAALVDLPQVIAVSITVEGAPLEVDGLTSPVSDTADVGLAEPETAQVGVLPLLRVRAGSSTVLHRVTHTNIHAAAVSMTADGVGDADSGFPRVGDAFRYLGLSHGGDEVAAVSGGELARYRDNGTGLGSVTNFGDDLTGPAYDPWGWLLVGGRASPSGSSPGRLWRVDSAVWPPELPDGNAVVLRAPWLAEREPVALAISPDGWRAAVISTDARGDARLDVAGVIREPYTRAQRPDEAAPLPTGMSDQPLTLVSAVDDLLDVAWTSDIDLAVVGHDAAGQTEVSLIGLGQVERTLAPIQPAGGDDEGDRVGERGNVCTSEAGTSADQRQNISTLQTDRDEGNGDLVVTTGDGVCLRYLGGFRKLSFGIDVLVPGQ